MKPIQKTFLTLTILGTILYSGLFIGYQYIDAQTGRYNNTDSYSEADESVYPVRLDLNLLDVKTKIIGSSIIPNIQDTSSTSPSTISKNNLNNLSNLGNSSQKIPYTIVETTYTARARAFGGDIYLPAYREDIVSEAIITVPEEGSNAVVPSLNTVEILRALPQAKGKYLLHEYEEATLRIKVVYKVLPKAMPPRLVFATRLNTVLWYPAAYENGQNDPGLDPETGNRLIQIPLINATYIPQQVTRVNWQTEPIILLRDNKNLRANVSDIFDKIRMLLK